MDLNFTRSLTLVLVVLAGKLFAQCGGDSWRYTLAASGTDVVHRIVHHPNGDIYVGGTSNSFGSNDDLFLARYTSNMTLIWAKVYDLVGQDGGYSVDLVLGPSGHLYLSSIVVMGLSSDAALTKLDENGVVQWTRRVLPLPAYAEGRAVIEDYNGDVYLAGSTNSIGAGNSDAFLARFASNGDLVWLNSYGGSGFDHFTHIDRLEDGSFILGSQTSSFFSSTRKGFIARIDATGSVVEARQHGGGVYDDYNHAYRNSDNSYLRVGYTDSYGPGGRDVLVVLNDSIGNVIWSKAYGTNASNESGMNAVSDGSGGWFVAAHSGTSRIVHVIHIASDGSLVSTYRLDGQVLHGSSLWTQVIYSAPDIGYFITAATTGTLSSSGWDLAVTRLNSCAEYACGMTEVMWSSTDFDIPSQAIPLQISGTSSSAPPIATTVQDVTPGLSTVQVHEPCSVCPVEFSYADVQGCVDEELLFEVSGDTTLFSEWIWTWDLGDGQTSDSSGDLEYSYSEPGNYSVLVIAASTTDACSDTISFNVQINEQAVVDLGPDIVQCDQVGEEVWLSSGSDGLPHLWSTGSTATSIEVLESGTYWVETGTDGCSASDTVQVSFISVPFVDLGPDTVVCASEGLLLHAGYDEGVQWQDGTTGPVYLADDPGTYSVIVDLDGCVGGDQINIGIDHDPLLSVSPDTLLCDMEPLIISVSSATNDQLTWNNGSTGASIVVYSPGVYTVSVSNACGIFMDSIHVDVVQPFPHPEDRVVCPSENTLISFEGHANSVSWSNGSEMLAADLPPGLHTYEAIDIYGCIRSGSIELIVDDEADGLSFIPNVFTPNSDGVNDNFQVVGAERDGFLMEIFNRWGAAIYTTTSPDIGWNGIVNGSPAPDGTYVYTVRYRTKCLFPEIQEQTGHVTLLR